MFFKPAGHTQIHCEISLFLSKRVTVWGCLWTGCLFAVSWPVSCAATFLSPGDQVTWWPDDIWPPLTPSVKTVTFLWEVLQEETPVTGQNNEDEEDPCSQTTGWLCCREAGAELSLAAYWIKWEKNSESSSEILKPQVQTLDLLLLLFSCCSCSPIFLLLWPFEIFCLLFIFFFFSLTSVFLLWQEVSLIVIIIMADWTDCLNFGISVAKQASEVRVVSLVSQIWILIGCWNLLVEFDVKFWLMIIIEIRREQLG